LFDLLTQVVAIRLNDAIGRNGDAQAFFLSAGKPHIQSMSPRASRTFIYRDGKRPARELCELT
jgi:hypothetical protein